MAKEKDDDSPYFVMIALDSRFLAFLEDPRLVDPTDIAEKCDLFLQNQVFKDIIRGEINRMFADNAQANQSDKNLDDNISKTSKLDGLKFKDGTPIRETIEESSRVHHSLETKQDYNQDKKVPKIDFQMATEQSMTINEDNYYNNKMNILENKTKDSADNMSQKG